MTRWRYLECGSPSTSPRNVGTFSDLPWKRSNPYIGTHNIIYAWMDCLRSFGLLLQSVLVTLPQFTPQGLANVWRPQYHLDMCNWTKQWCFGAELHQVDSYHILCIKCISGLDWRIDRKFVRWVGCWSTSNACFLKTFSNRCFLQMSGTCTSPWVTDKWQ